MSHRTRLAGILILVAAWGTSARAVAPEIRDLGKFFSADAIKKADAAIRDIARKHNLDLLVETYPTVPTDQVEKVKALDAKGRTEFFNHWAEERVKERVVHGVYILICQEPRYLKVEISGRGRKVFTPEDRDRIFKAIRTEFAGGRFDDGLHAVVRLVEQHLSKDSAK